jgi:hypothetical protein
MKYRGLQEMLKRYFGNKSMAEQFENSVQIVVRIEVNNQFSAPIGRFFDVNLG